MEYGAISGSNCSQKQKVVDFRNLLVGKSKSITKSKEKDLDLAASDNSNINIKGNKNQVRAFRNLLVKGIY